MSRHEQITFKSHIQRSWSAQLEITLHLDISLSIKPKSRETLRQLYFPSTLRIRFNDRKPDPDLSFHRENRFQPCCNDFVSGPVNRNIGNGGHFGVKARLSMEHGDHSWNSWRDRKPFKVIWLLLSNSCSFVNNCSIFRNLSKVHRHRNVTDTWNTVLSWLLHPYKHISISEQPIQTLMLHKNLDQEYARDSSLLVSCQINSWFEAGPLELLTLFWYRQPHDVIDWHKRGLFTNSRISIEQQWIPPFLKTT